MEKHLNIIAFNIPYPANYGGVIDVYYKLLALKSCGVKIHLHCFEYGRAHAPELNQLCEEVFYYQRNTGMTANISLLPYTVYSRKCSLLLQNLQKNDYPILFEGLYSCYYLSHPKLANRIKIFRECNIEHDYYKYLAIAERDFGKKAFFSIEAIRLEAYQKNLKHVDGMAAVSTADADYLKLHFPEKRVEFIPCFHQNEQITSVPGHSKYLLYHGNLSVSENERAAIYLIEHVFSKLKHSCIVAGLSPSAKLRQLAFRYRNIYLEANPTETRMNDLIRNAQVHVLITFQNTGLKLKLLHVLFAGRHVVVNPMMLSGSGLDSLCHIANSPETLIKSCNELMKEPFTHESIAKRETLLLPGFSNIYQAQKLCELIYGKSGNNCDN